MEEISEIKTIRKNLGITQTQLAKESGVSQALIARLEKGGVDARYSHIKSIFEALKRMQMKKYKKEITAENIMNTNIICVSKFDTIEQTSKIMTKYNVSQLPVLENKKIVGCVSEKTLIKEISSGKNMSEISKKKIYEIMDPSLPTLNKQSPITLVSTLLEEYPAVIVIDTGKIEGIITKADLLKFLKNDRKK